MKINIFFIKQSMVGNEAIYYNQAVMNSEIFHRTLSISSVPTKTLLNRRSNTESPTGVRNFSRQATLEQHTVHQQLI